MSQHAHVSSVHALDSFRADLIVYLSKVKPALFEVSDELARTKNWLNIEQRAFWDNEIRKRGRKLEELQNELFDARLSQLKRPTALQHMAVQKARQSLEEALAHKAVLQRWSREVDHTVDPLLKHVDQLQSFLTTDISHAINYLGEMVRTLESYAAIKSSAGTVFSDQAEPASADAPPEPPAGNS